MQIEGAVDVAHRREVAAAEDPAAKRAEIIAGYREQVGPVQAASGFGVDDVVDPRDTRARLIEVLERAAPRRYNTHPPKRHGIAPI
jgi:propionyl-CoA carboxylase beta chain